MAEEGLRISDAYTQRNNGRTHGGIILVGSDMTEANVTQRTKGWTLDELTEYVKSGIPAAPEGVVWIEQPIIEIEENTFIRAIYPAQADWDGLIVSYPEGTVQNATLPGAGLERFDAVYALENGTYGVSTGDASQSPVTPQIPNNALFVTYVKWTSTGGSLSTLPTYTNVHTKELYKHPVSYLRYPDTTGLGFPEGVDSFYGYGVVTSEPGVSEGRLTLYRSNGEVYHQARGWNNGIVYSEWLKMTRGDEFYPQNGSAGTIITITGIAMNNITEVFFLEDGSALEIVTQSPTLIAVRVIEMYFEKSRLLLSFADGSSRVTDKEFLNVTSSITSITPTSMAAGDVITLTGEKLGLLTYVVFPGEVMAPVKRISEQEATVKVPYGITEGLQQALRPYMESGNSIPTPVNVDITDGGGTGGGTTEGEATLEAASTSLGFINPFGHIRTDAITQAGAASTFTKSGTKLGSTIVQPFTSDGSALNFNFAHTVLNSDFVSGQALATGEYRLFFVNYGASVDVSIATVGAGTEPEPNQAPAANAGADQSITLPTDSVTLNGSGTDPDGTIASYAWSKVSGGAATITSPSSASTTVTGLVEGSYTFRLAVTDNGGLTATDDVVVTVNAQGNITPAAPTNGVVDDTANTFTFTLAAN